MNVSLVGSGPALSAIDAMFSDADVATTRTEPSAIADATLAVVSGVAGASSFERASEAATRGDTHWIAVEIGGIGGRAVPSVDAAVTGFGPGAGCYRCLQTRVAANAESDGEDDPSGDRRTARLAGSIAGHRAIGALSGDEPLAGRIVELPWTDRQFLPVPGCDRCGSDRDRTIERSYETVPLEEALARAEQSFDERVGIVGSVGEAESFPAPYYLATLADTAEFSDATAATQAAGVDAGWDGAFMKALGEAGERYAAGVYREREFERAPATELDDALSPASVVAPGDTPDPDDPISWVDGVRLDADDTASADARARLPAELVHFPPPERRIRPAITTGLGLGSSIDGALRSGLTEAIERDATMLSWYSTFEPLGLAVDDDAFDALIRRARSEGLSISTVLLTQDVDVPVVAVALSGAAWPEFAVGSAAAIDAVAAARGALAEALQNWMELRSMGRERASDEEPTLARYASDPGPAAAFFDPESRVPAREVGLESPPEGSEALDALIDRSVDAGLEPYAARLTPADLDRIGLEAVRVVVPSAQPLFTGDPYFGERARTVPTELGFEPRLDRARHPFP